ncbi:hypothetical protein B0J11DRAFT_569703 [Dendryphion nanum]|uniref:Uncharacterized protein n=1 Tax=Dendryphion nanum TaxID=256645 RepID=A0A9P9DKM9_9PLEO|nr:hypothetical protein B0J11DRAFT_569703 [Dendryphion nanum]
MRDAPMRLDYCLRGRLWSARGVWCLVNVVEVKAHDQVQLATTSTPTPNCTDIAMHSPRGKVNPWTCPSFTTTHVNFGAISGEAQQQQREREGRPAIYGLPRPPLPSSIHHLRHTDNNVGPFPRTSHRPLCTAVNNTATPTKQSPYRPICIPRPQSIPSEVPRRTRFQAGAMTNWSTAQVSTKNWSEGLPASPAPVTPPTSPLFGVSDDEHSHGHGSDIKGVLHVGGEASLSREGQSCSAIDRQSLALVTFHSFMLLQHRRNTTFRSLETRPNQNSRSWETARKGDGDNKHDEGDLNMACKKCTMRIFLALSVRAETSLILLTIRNAVIPESRHPQVLGSWRATCGAGSVSVMRRIWNVQWN